MDWIKVAEVRIHCTCFVTTRIKLQLRLRTRNTLTNKTTKTSSKKTRHL